MSIELLPLNKSCNLRCTYCYQTDERTATQNSAPPYSLDKMKAALLAEGVGKPDGKGGTIGFSLFGGEPLLLPLRDLEDLLEWARQQGTYFGVQTNGTILTDHHVRLFKHYSVSVGVSMDGPDDLNDARESCNPRATRSTTALSQRNLERLLAEGISVSLIVTLASTNAGSVEKLERLVTWLLDLQQKGVKYLNLHKLEPHGDPTLSLSPDQATSAFRYLRTRLTGFSELHPFDDMRASLLQSGGTHCIFNFCDPYTTPAVHGVDGQGQRMNCGRTNTNGVGWEKSQIAGHERQLALYLTPKEQGGCGGCRFFLACGGGNCPGEGEGGDWRARTVHCSTLTALFSDLEQELFSEGKEPISMSLRRPGLEARLLEQWAGITSATDSPHGDAPHGDIPHGDSHGDHTDTSAVPAS